jgi:beta-lactamase superfamily II metal-dependent hydrolase
MSAKIYFIWVGQGDCTLIRTDTNKLILIDCGTSDDQSIYTDNVKPTIEAVLKDAGKTSIDYLILTHSDKDHCNLVKSLFDIKNFYFGKAYYGGSAFQYSRYIDFDDEDQVKKTIDLESHYTNLFIDTVINDTDFKLWIIGANFPYNTTPPDVPYDKDINKSSNRTKAIRSIYDNNGNSLMLVLSYKGFKVFFLGDATIAEQDYIYEAAKDGGILADFAVKVFKMAHHGSPDSFSDNLTNKAAKPPMLTASAGVTFGHPSEQTVDTVKSLSLTGALKHNLVLYDTEDQSYSRFNNVVKFMFNSMTWYEESSITVPTETPGGKRSRDPKAGSPYLGLIGSNWLFELIDATTANITEGSKKTILTTKGTTAVTAKKRRKKGKGFVAVAARPPARPPLRVRVEFQEEGPPRVIDLSGTPEEP